MTKVLLRALYRLLRVGRDTRALLVGFRKSPLGLSDDLAICKGRWPLLVGFLAMRHLRAWHIGGPRTSAQRFREVIARRNLKGPC